MLYFNAVRENWGIKAEHYWKDVWALNRKKAYKALTA